MEIAVLRGVQPELEEWSSSHCLSPESPTESKDLLYSRCEGQRSHNFVAAKIVAKMIIRWYLETIAMLSNGGTTERNLWKTWLHGGECARRSGKERAL